MNQGTTTPEPSSNYVEALQQGVPFLNQDGVLEYPTMRSRPYPEFTLGPLHRLLLIGSLTIVACHTLWIAARIPSMPDQVPMHFSADGSVNRYGSPWEIIGFSSLMILVIIGCAVLVRYPRIYNYGIGKTTEHNIQAHYKNGVQMMVWMVVSMAALQVTAVGGMAGDWPISPAIWFFMALMLGSVMFFILRMFRI